MEPKYADDVFFSFEPLDDEPVKGHDEGRITNLRRALKARLAGILGREPRIWTDPTLGEAGSLPADSGERLAQTATFLAVLTPRYLDSAARLRELDRFSRLVGLVGRKDRMLKVEMNPVALEQEPEETRELRSYELWVEKNDVDRTGPLYWLKLDELARNVGRVVNGATAEAQAPAQLSKGAVYLAQTGPDLKSARDAIARELSSHGYQVLPDRAPPLVASKRELFVKQQLEPSGLSVHLLGPEPGSEPGGANQSLPLLEADVAIARAVTQPGVSILFWKPPGPSAEHDGLPAFFSRLEVDPGLGENAEFLETSLEEFKDAVLNRLESPPRGAHGANHPARMSRGIYLICDQSDQEECSEIAKFVFKQGLEVRQSLFSTDQAEVRAHHEANLVRQEVLIFHRRGSREWLERMLRDLRKSAGYSESAAAPSHGVLLATPEAPEEHGLDSGGIPVFHQAGAFDPTVLREFLGGASSSGNRRSAIARSPFPGERSFGLEDDLVFFGREAATETVLARLRSSRFASVLGPSGSGKSSLLRAGLVSALHGGFMADAGSDWRILDLRPGARPIADLAAALGSNVLGRQAGDATGRAITESTLRSSSRGLVDCLLEAALPPNVNVLVLVDPLEDLLRLEDDPGHGGTREEARALIKLLLRAARGREVPLYVAGALDTADAELAAEFPDLTQAINDGSYLLPRMRREECRIAITGPVQVGGGEIAPRLVTRLLNDYWDQPKPLSALQQTLARIWTRWNADSSDQAPIDLRHYEST